MQEPDLESELRRAAEATARSILDDARAEAERILEEADAEVARARREAMRRHELAVRARGRTTVAGATREATRRLLEAEAHAIDRVLAELRTMLAEAARSEAYRATLAATVGRALAFVREGEATVIRCAPELAEAVKVAVGDREAVRVTPDGAVTAGFVVETEDGTLRIDERAETRLEAARADLAIAIGTLLEPEDDASVPR